jgi:hypothetical protein
MSVASTGIVVSDSVTTARVPATGAVVVCGSHGGQTAAAYATRLRVCGVIFNDAGVGKDDAGIEGLAMLDDQHIPAAAVSHLTARIGDGNDTYECGVVKHLNRAAEEAGGAMAMRAKELANVLAAQGHSIPAQPLFHEVRTHRVLDGGTPSIVLVDSAAELGPADRGAIVLTGSHGGLVYGKTLKVPVAAAFFNDAGFGKERAGILRVEALEDEGAAGLAVSHTSAKIGAALETYESGVVSFRNGLAARYGIEVGVTAREAVLILVSRLREKDRYDG